MARLERDFFARRPEIVAQDLIGKLLVRSLEDGTRLSGYIVETEAYLAEGDGAAHNKYGKTEAKKSLYADAGTLYVHPMRQYVGIDIVTETIDVPSSVLIRALEPHEGISFMALTMGLEDVTKLTNGPGKLCKAMGIKRDMDGLSILDDHSKIFVEEMRCNTSVASSTRIGISQAKDMPLRYYQDNSKFISK